MNRIVQYLALLPWLLLSVAATPSYGQEGAHNQTVNGQRVGFWSIKNAQGWRSEGNYKEGEKDGEWREYTPEGTLNQTMTYVKGVASGPVTTYYDDGTVMERGIWRRDHWEETYVRNHPNGTKACALIYNADGKRQGKQLYYRANGTLLYEGDWDNGKLQGELSRFDEQGKKIAAPGEEPPALEAQEFKRTGELTIFNNKGQREQRGTFKEGKLVNGQKFFYDAAGRLIRTEIWRNGQKIGEKK